MFENQLKQTNVRRIKEMRRQIEESHNTRETRRVVVSAYVDRFVVYEQKKKFAKILELIRLLFTFDESESTILTETTN